MNLYLDDKQVKVLQDKIREINEIESTFEKLAIKEELLTLLFDPNVYMTKKSKKTPLQQWFYDEEEMYAKIRRKRQQCERKNYQKKNKEEQ